MSRFLYLPIALFATHAFAQTYTLCNPRNETCPADAALGTTYNETFDANTLELNPNLWNVTAGADGIQFTDNGAELTISKSGESVTIESTFYVFWGQIEVMMQAAAGTGIISTFDLLSDDLDEIDLEIKGGNSSFVFSNWFGWGNTSQYNGGDHPCQGPADTFHNFTIVWDKDQLQWIIDGAVARTVPYAISGQYPQTPSILKIGIWAGGDSTQGADRIAWAGGQTDWDQGPFTLTVQSVKVVDGTTNSSTYTYGDQTGSYESIKAVTGQSKAYKILNKQSTSQQLESHWNGLSTGAKIGIGAGIGGAFLVAIVAFAAFCVVQRKRGRAERAAADKQWDEHQNELMEYRQRMAKGDFAISHMGHGEKF